MWKKTKRCLTILFASLSCALLSACGGSSSRTEITSLSQLNDSSIHIGVATDTAEDRIVSQEFPKAKMEYFKGEMQGFIAVSQGKLDAFIFDELEMKMAIKNGLSGVKLLDERIGEPNYGAVAISPATSFPNLLGDVNAFLKEIEGNGVLADMKSRWQENMDFTMPHIEPPKNPTAHLVVGTSGLVVPFTFYSGTELVGYDIELAHRFASYLNASLEFKIYDYESIVAAALTGDIDCVFSNLFITPERQESIAFSTPTYVGRVAAMVRDPNSATKTIDDLERGNIGFLTGSNHPEHVAARLPNATLSPFNSLADMLGALNTGKIDAAAIDQPVAHSLLSEQPGLQVIPELLANLDYAFVMPKTATGESLKAELDAFLVGLKTTGRLAGMQKKWFEADDLSTVPMTDYTGFPATQGTIKLITMQNPPFAFLSNGILAGYEIELMALFCQQAGYALEVTDVNLDAVLPSILSDMYDIAGCGMTITEERKESVLFSEPDYSGGTALLVRKESAGGGGQNFFQYLAESFDKTFIRESRWLLFLQGIGTTMLITALSILFGTILGFGMFLLCRRGNKVANVIAKFFVWLIQGMPVVVLLMILYYIFFARVSITGEAVSIVGFTLVFGSGVFNMLKSGVGTIDKGQMEAAFALGYRDTRAFFRIILPQALPHMLPIYRGEITALIKATAIVGYVAVQDVTKIGDLIRSRTFEPFFPLIAVAIIYFLLAAILIFLVNRLEFFLNPKRRKQKKLLKGVNRS